MSSSFGNKIARSLVSSKCDLRACKSVKFAFNPWQLETKSIRYSSCCLNLEVDSAAIFVRLTFCVCVNQRDVYTYLNSARMRESNDKCKLIADIRSDLMEPHIEIQFGKNFLILFLFYLIKM